MNSIFPILTIIITVYFFKEQFEFKKVFLARYIAMPAYGAFQFFTSVKLTGSNDVYWLVCIFVLSCAIGWYQTSSFQIVSKKEATQFYSIVSNQKNAIYRDAYYSKGGKSYLIGWIFIFIVQILIGLIQRTIALDEISSEWFSEILKDLFVFARVQTHASWLFWELYAVSNLSYFIILIKKNNSMREAMKKSNN